MRTFSRTLISLVAATAALATAGSVSAQVDVNPPAPNVLLLIDSSGSMEFKSGAVDYPVCDSSTGTYEKSRWVDLVEVLSGTISDYRCEAIDRQASTFGTEYSLQGLAPPDYKYVVPYHRPMSAACVCDGDGVGNDLCKPTAGDLSTVADGTPWVSPGFVKDGLLTPSCDPLPQAADGLIDVFRDRVRFGLMTFDTRLHEGTGPAFATGVQGTWSYFLGTPASGRPVGCATDATVEVGARSYTAPSWEGRMIPFGAPSDSPVVGNERVQQVLLSSRPYGATPIAGILDDARSFLYADTVVGPKDDPFIDDGCRKNVVVLLTDGEPNLDLRPDCAMSGDPAGDCPFDLPEEIAEDIFTDPSKPAQVFVVGFASSEVTVSGVATPVDCETTDKATLDTYCAAEPTNQALQVCCTLNKIAYSGGTTHAYFADDRQTLRAALGRILNTVSGGTTSRTLPVFASGSSARDTFAGSYRFFTSFRAPNFDLWGGTIERQRVVCEKDPGTGDIAPVFQDISQTLGDDFVANTQAGVVANRKFYWVEPSGSATSLDADRAVRPAITSDVDGVGVQQASMATGAAAALVSGISAATMGVTAATCGTSTATACRDTILEWLVGLDNGTPYHRCPTATDCNLIGAVYHSTPKVVGTPADYLRDESYAVFAGDNRRDLVLYTSTIDGFLHAFKVAPPPGATTGKVDSKANNELWSFMPPAVMPLLSTQYPPSPANLLDGAPVVRDVVATAVTGQPHVMERTTASARGSTNTWRTVLVQGFGLNRPGYFALDVTDPSSPRFLWQLTTDVNGGRLFGDGGGTPLITTVFMTPGAGQDPREVAVAVLPGGTATPADPLTACDRKATTFPTVDSSFNPRAQVRCYGAGLPGARSLTIVRLDTGEVIRTFRQDAADAPQILSSRVTQADLDSPISGQPVAFPGDTGAIADRLFVGDQDGTLWRVDLASPDPSDWTMDMFFDLYSTMGPLDGQSIQTPPVVSVDLLGQVTVAVSSGDQEDLRTPTTTNYAWSITEVPDSSSVPVSSANWYVEMIEGERVVGPMTLFDSVLYFSTYKPRPLGEESCLLGTARVFGMHYAEPETAGAPQDGGAARLAIPGATTLVQFIDNTATLLAGATVFGVGVQQLPTCNETDGTFTDDFLGYAGHTSITNLNPGKFQLVMQAGKSGGSAPVGGQTNVIAFDLPTPPSGTRIDSWAAVLE